MFFVSIRMLQLLFVAHFIASRPYRPYLLDRCLFEMSYVYDTLLSRQKRMEESPISFFNTINRLSVLDYLSEFLIRRLPHGSQLQHPVYIAYGGCK